MIPKNSALLVIDVQRGLDHPKYGRRNNPDAEANIARLLGAWRRIAWPVVHVQHLSTSRDSPLRPDSPGVEIKPEAAPRDGEPLFQKRVKRLSEEVSWCLAPSFPGWSLKDPAGNLLESKRMVPTFVSVTERMIRVDMLEDPT